MPRGRRVPSDAEPRVTRAAVPGPADPARCVLTRVSPQAGVRMGTCPSHVPMDEAGDDAESDGSEMTDAGVAAVEPAGNPVALGSAFHAAPVARSRWVPTRCPLSVPMRWRVCGA